MTEYEQSRILVATGDITKVNVNAVVNAANESLLGGGGVDGAIHAAGGPAILAECQDIRRRRYPHGLPTGKAVVTTGGDLPAGYVIHTVGPVWRGGGSDEEQLLTDAYSNSLKLATETGISTVAFPAISTGVFGYPKDKASRVAYTTIRDYLRKHSLPRVVHLVFFSKKDMELFEDSIQTLTEE